MTEDLVHGRITRERLLELLMTGSYYGSFRDLSMALPAQASLAQS